MADFIVMAILIIVAVLVIRKLYKDYKKYGTCAGCAEAQLGHCDHVGHKELDERRAELERLKLNEVQKAILARKSREKLKNK